MKKLRGNPLSIAYSSRKEKRKLESSYVLKRLDDFFHVNKLAIVRLVREIHIDSPDFVRRHFEFDEPFAVGLKKSISVVKTLLYLLH